MTSKIKDISKLVKDIKNGELGENLAKRAQKAGRLNLQELKGLEIDYPVFHFNDGTADYTVLIEKNKLILLCKSRDGGPARNFKLSNSTGHKVLFFEYDSATGIGNRKQGRYSLGSGKSLVSDNN